MEPAKVDEVLGEIDRLVAKLVVADSVASIPTSWVLVVGSTQMEWRDGTESITTWSPNVPYSTRLGLLTSAMNDLKDVVMIRAVQRLVDGE